MFFGWNISLESNLKQLNSTSMNKFIFEIESKTRCGWNYYYFPSKPRDDFKTKRHKSYKEFKRIQRVCSQSSSGLLTWKEKDKFNQKDSREWLASRESNFNTKINASSFHWSLSFMRNRFEFKDRKRLKDKALRVHPSLPFNSSQSLSFHAFSGLKNLWRQIQRNSIHFLLKTQSSIDNQTNETESFQCKSF